MELTTAPSPYSVADTVDRLMASLERRGIRVFARIDHAGNARAAGMALPAEEVLIFGDPGAGTRLMQVDPRIGLELPLRLLVWSEDGATRIGYRSPQEVAAEYDLPGPAQVLSTMSDLLARLAEEASERSAA